ncbi:MAG: hypothetical protein ACRD11_00425 [Terriglobia bacterium]
MTQNTLDHASLFSPAAINALAFATYELYISGLPEAALDWRRGGVGERITWRGFLPGAIVLITIFLRCPVTYSRTRPLGFPIPARMLPLGNAVTPGEYAQFELAIKSYCNRAKARDLQTGPCLGTNFTHIQAGRVKLGALGEEFVVSFSHSSGCGNGGCPMALFVREAKGYRLTVMSGGGGYALLPSGGPVPDVAFYWNMGGGDTTVQSFHYAHGKFAPAGNADCTPKNNPSPVCAGIGEARSTISEMTIAPAEYDALRPVFEADIERQSPTLAAQLPFKDAHALNFGGSNLALVTALTLGPCGASRNCRISIYAHHYQGGFYLYGRDR